MSDERVVRAVCPHDCPDACGMLATVRGGRLISVAGDPTHPFTRGHLCRKVAHYEERVYSPDRVLYPQRRIGPKGAGEFERITWNQALDEIAARWRAIIESDGPEAILPYSYAGTMGVVNMHACEGRLWYRMGASQLQRTICSTAGEAGQTYTMGWSGGMDPEAFARSRTIIAWGTNLSSTNVHQMPFIREAQKKGATFIVVDVFRTRAAQCADWYVPVRPGTDAALALGMMCVIFAEGLHDERYLVDHTIGWRELRERSAEYPPSRVAKITGVPEADVVRLARTYALERPAAIRLGYGATRNSNGGMIARTITCLPAVVGAWKELGGGLLLSASPFFQWNRHRVKRPDLLPSPPPRAINMNRLGEALTSLKDPPIKSLMVWNSNPAVVAPRSRLVRQGLLREDLFTVVHEQMLTDTARYADILLPATTQMEHLDLHFSYGHAYVQLNQPAIAPMGEARPNIEVQHDLARRMGYTEPCFQESAEEIIRGALDTDSPRMEGITFERLQQEGHIKVGPEPAAGLLAEEGLLRPFVQGLGFKTPSGKIELYSEAVRRDGYDPLPAYTPPAESPEGSPDLWHRYPLQLISPAAHNFLNSTFANLEWHTRWEKQPRIWIHPKDAAERGIRDGQEVRVWNDQGEVRLAAEISELAAPGVVWTPTLWWHSRLPKGEGVNVLTSDRLTDMGGGSTFHTNLVEIAPADD